MTAPDIIAPDITASYDAGTRLLVVQQLRKNPKRLETILTWRIPADGSPHTAD